jgi:Transglycosylase-like domain
MARRLSAFAVIVLAVTATILTAPASGARVSAGSAGSGGLNTPDGPRLVPVVHVLRAHRIPAAYRLRAGEYLSLVAQRFCHNQADWIGIWHATKPHLANPNMVPVGLTVTIACNHSGAGYYPPRPVYRVSSTIRHHYRSYRSSGYHSTYQHATASSFAGVGSYERCVIARESGGNSQVMNSSGHYGLYQFSASTWAAYGGSALAFGHASAGEQRRVFLNAMAQGGQSNWSPYDGC